MEVKHVLNKDKDLTPVDDGGNDSGVTGGYNEQQKDPKYWVWVVVIIAALTAIVYLIK